MHCNECPEYDRLEVLEIQARDNKIASISQAERQRLIDEEESIKGQISNHYYAHKRKREATGY
jgi:hypothetical protein